MAIMSLRVLFVLVLLSCVFYSVFGEAKAPIHSSKLYRPYNNSVSSLLVFGDSTVDPGNNNFIPTPFRSNFPPYGRDFYNHIATGRFTNGRLATDYIVSYLGIKEYVPPYLDPKLSLDELMTGVSFASAGSGFDPLTPRLTSVISLQKQFEYFKEYKARLEVAIGKKRTKTLIRKAAFIISAGTNDFVVNYFGAPLRRQTFTIPAYQEFLLGQVRDLLQGLIDEGAELIGVVGLPPMGCLPMVITLFSDNAFLHRWCIEPLSTVARDYNVKLQNELKTIQNKIPNSKIVYPDIYKPLDEMIRGPRNFGLHHAKEGCCGSGILEASLLCNPKSQVCSDASKYVFWDAIHPSQVAYYNIFEAVRPTIDLLIKD